MRRSCPKIPAWARALVTSIAEQHRSCLAGPSAASRCPFTGVTGTTAPSSCPVESEDDDRALPVLTTKQIINQLGKAKLSAFVTSTASASYVLCCGVEPVSLLAVTLGTYLQSLSANTANQCIEIENDRLMKRTQKRPLVINAIARPTAVALSASELALGTAVLYSLCNPLTAALGVANWVMYVAVYTPLKRLSTTNTWWGAVVGAVPPLMGGAAATGGLTSPLLGPAYVLAGIMFVWQIPHFMSLAFHCRRDYEKAGFKMLPFTHPVRSTVYAVSMSVVLAVLTVPGPVAAGMVVEPWYIAASSVCNIGMVYKSVRFFVHPEKYCRSCFVYSYMYLAVMLALLVGNHFQPQHAVMHFIHRHQHDEDDHPPVPSAAPMSSK